MKKDLSGFIDSGATLKFGPGKWKDTKKSLLKSNNDSATWTLAISAIKFDFIEGDICFALQITDSMVYNKVNMFDSISLSCCSCFRSCPN